MHLRTKECDLVQGLSAAGQKPQAVIIGVAIDSRAHLVHALNVLRPDYGPLPAGFGRDWRSGAAVWSYIWVAWHAMPCHVVSPLAKSELAAWCIAADDYIESWVYHLQIEVHCHVEPRRSQVHLFGCWTVLEGEVRAVHNLCRVWYMHAGVVEAISGDLELERNSEAVH